MNAIKTTFMPTDSLGNSSYFRQVFLLATGIFLLIAPPFDAQLIAEVSANFIVG